MALGVMVLSTERGKLSATLITATSEEARELGENFSLPAFNLKDIGQKVALDYVSKAWGIMSDRWNLANNGK
jgi:hypothetical protein